MALSGSFSKSVHSGHYGIRVDWSATQSVANNTSTITAKIYYVNDWSISIGSRSNNTLTIAGKSYKFSSPAINTTGTHLLATITSDPISHNSDGSKSVSMSCSFYMNATISGDSYYGYITANSTATLTTIARASQPSLVTYPESTSAIGEFGKDFTIYTNRASSSFTHTVRYEYGSRSGTIATGVGTSTTWKVPLSFMDDIPSATSASGRIYVDTYNGSTKIGTKYTGFSVKVPDSVKPACTLTLTDTTGVDKTYGSPVKGLSKIKVTVSTTLAYSSPVASCTISANGVSYSGTTATTGALSKSGTSTVTATVTDKRGRKGTVSYDMSVLNYSAPKVSALSVRRCDANGTVNDRGEYIKATFSASVSSMSSKNTATYKLKYKKTGDSTYTTVSLSALANQFSVSSYSYTFAADGGSSYDVSVTATDKHKTATRSTTASTAFTLLNFHEKGNAVRFGGVAEKENTLQNDLALRQAGNSYAFQPEAFDGSKGYTLLSAITLKELNVNAPIVFKINRRGALCPMTVYIRFASSSTTTDPGLGSITYEGDNFGAFLVKSGTSAWKLYVDNTAGWLNPCLQEWYTTDNQMSRMSVSFPSEFVAGTDPSVLGTYYRATPAKLQSILDFIYPVGSIYLSYTHTSPESLFGGTWTRIQNAFLWATTASGTIGQTGGESEVTLSVNQIPSHSHGSVYSQHASGTKSQAWYTETGTSLAYGTVSTGGGEAHNNMPPYIQVSVWRRTA